MISFFSHAAADNLRLARSRVIASPDDDTYGLIRMPRYAFLLNVWVDLITAYSSGTSGTITFGIEGNGAAADPDAILTSAEVDPDAAGFVSMANGGAAAAANGYWFDTASGSITGTFTIGDSSVNCTLIVFAQYTILT